MQPDDFLIDARRLWPGEEAWTGPIALVRLDGGTLPTDALVLPACPVIGIGDAAHPLASALDAVIEPPVEIARIVAQVTANPLAAATVVQLLRLLPALPWQQGLVAESMAYAMLQGSEEHHRWLAARTVNAEQAAEQVAQGQVIADRQQTHLAVTLHRPWAGNAIDRIMRDGLYEALALAALDPEIECVTLAAHGRAFSLGAEIAEFGTTIDPATAHAIRTQTLPAHAAMRCADKLDAHVQGGCVGAGLEIAAWARRITATSNAWFQLPELAMGILPGAGGCVSLTRRIGRQRTALMILSGKRISARTALVWRLVDRIVDDLT